VDWVRVKGKAKPVKIFELIAEKKAPETMTEVLKWFQEGYLKYHEKSWSAATEAFTKALNIKPDDEVSKVYLTRCQDYLVEAPPDDWDGVFVMKTK
jgi:adenylate cyclase